MKYRWGFLDENGIFSECQPKVDDSTAIDFSQESGEMFYRGKINGSLAFRFEFDDILSKGFNYEHIVILQWYDADNDEWKEVWKGRFALTDCEIDYDTKTITVQPTTLDRYTTILNHLEDEYNLIKLAAQQQPVGIQIRPLMQFYSLNDSKIVNLIGGNSWEASCETTGASNIETDYHFRMIQENLAFWLSFDNTVPNADLQNKTILLSGTPDYSGTPRVFDMTGQYWDGSAYSTLTLRCQIALFSDETQFALYWPSGVGWEVNPFVVAIFERDEAGTSAAITQYSYLTDSNAQWDKIYFRILLNAEGSTYHGQPLFDLSSSDMAGTNLNYNKISQIAPVNIIFYQNTQSAPTEWGLSYNEEYFLKPAGQVIPIGQGLWKYVSVWGTILAPYYTFDDAIKTVTIRDCYKLPSVITRLFQKAGLTPQYFISRVLNGGNDYVGEPFYLCITPRSNVISSYYDTPAQNAPITLTKILMMLKQTYQIYWHIDANGNIHFEHISYYDNGYNYTEDAPGLLVDLESEIHTNTKNNKVFGQNQVKFDKQDMPQQIKFSWEDMQTPPFEGYAIKMLDKYVNQGNTEENAIGAFDSDVDFVLASPNDVSKDGMFLFACPVIGGAIHWNLNIQDFTIKDETGFEYDVSIQNADAAFWKIHQSFWRYALPCENVNINNEDTTAITTGRFKVQSVEFADVIMADILKDIDNCNKVIRTQQGDGHIKTISINLNSLVAKGDLLFNFIGRWYYLKGTAIGSSINIFVNGESITVDVTDNKFTYRYKEPISTLTFNAADVVSVNFADCDKLDNLTSCDEMFDGCEELIAVDFGGKTFGAVTTANNMFRGCVALTTLICPDSSTWKADLDLSDCPDFTKESFYDLIKFLYFYESGVHTITPNSAMWNALDGDTQTDLIAKATERGWTINMPAAYSISGQSAGNTVYATINGSPVEIPVVGGLWQYDYNAAITSISFENDADVTDIDFSLSDGLAGVTSLNDAFKNCAGLTTVDFTNCDLSNVASASDAFAGCTSLYELIIPAGTWKPDVDLSDTVIMYAEMSHVISGLFTYSSGTHTITFNSTIWDALSVAQQQTIFDAAQLKWWTTNAVAVVYKIKGTSSNVNGTETFNVQFIDDGALSPSAAESITCAVDANGDWEYQYNGKKIYSLDDSFYNNQTITQIEFNENFEAIDSMHRAFANSNIQKVIADNGTFSQLNSLNLAFNVMPQLTEIYFPNATFASVTDAYGAFAQTSNVISKIILPNATFASCLSARLMFNSVAATEIRMPNATFANCTNANSMFISCSSLTTLDISNATFASVTDAESMFQGCASLTSIDLSGCNFANATTLRQMFQSCSALTTIDLSNQTFASATTALNMFQSCSALTTIDLSGATFVALTNASGMFFQCTNLASVDLSGTTFGALTNMYQMFQQCSALTSVDLSNKTFANVTTTYQMFYQCSALTSVNMSNATFAANTNTYLMFYQCSALTSISISNATFAALTDAAGMFRGCNHLTSLDLNSATFANLQRAWLMFDGCTLLQTLDMSNATFAKVNNSQSLVSGCNALTTWILTQQSTAILPSASVGNTPINAQWSPLSYQSMLNVANWVCDLTGYSAHTCAFKATAWNALSTAEQNTIDTILSGKNWTRAIA